MTLYRLDYSTSVRTEDIPALPKSAAALIKKAIERRLAVNPLLYGKPLRKNLHGYRRLRVSDYRVIYRVDEPAKTVHIVAIGYRRDIYEDFDDA